MTQKCKKCGSEDIIKFGIQFFARLGRRQMWKCKKCGYVGTGEQLPTTE